VLLDEANELRCWRWCWWWWWQVNGDASL